MRDVIVGAVSDRPVEVAEARRLILTPADLEEVPLDVRAQVEQSGAAGPVVGRAELGTGHSEYWRKNTSALEPVELANLLRGMRKVAGHLGPNVGRVEYAGMSRDGGAAIVLEPSLVAGRYPVPPARVDYLVGFVVHEALHKIEWSDRVWTLLEPTFNTMGGLPLVRLQKIVHVGEDIYIESVAERTTFGLYTRRARQEPLPEGGLKMLTGEPSLDALLYLWWVAGCAGQPSLHPRAGYSGPLLILERLTEGLRTIAGLDTGPVDRCERRLQLYLESWKAIRSSVSSLRVIANTLHWYSFPVDEGAGRPRPASNLSAAATAALPQPLLQQVELELARNSADITPIIQSIVGYEEEAVAPTSRWDFNTPASPVIDPRVVARLKAIFWNYSARKITVSRGLSGGKVDPRRLYRAPISGRCFFQIESLADLDWNVTLVIDASGSMRGTKWQMVQNTVGNLHTALATLRSHLQAYAYFEVDGICMISQLIKDRQLLSVPPAGQTASGQAIIAAAYFMPKNRKRNLLIHVTDGRSNFGCDVRHAFAYCESRKIHLVTIGCGYEDREAMLRQYGRSLQCLDHFGQLPTAIERLLRWAFLYGDRSRGQNGRPSYLRIGGSAPAPVAESMASKT